MLNIAVFIDISYHCTTAGNPAIYVSLAGHRRVLGLPVTEDAFFHSDSSLYIVNDNFCALTINNPTYLNKPTTPYYLLAYLRGDL